MVMAIYLNIAAFNIQLTLRPSINKNLVEWQKQQILSSYANFIIKERPKRIHAVINFIDRKDDHSFFHKLGRQYFNKVYEEKSSNNISVFYIPSYYELQLILKKVLFDLLTKVQGFFIHCSAVEYNNKAIIFVGPSKAGKTTIVKLLKDRYQILADDLGVIREIGKTFYFFQTPFLEKIQLIEKLNQPYAIRGLFFLYKADKIRIRVVKNEATVFKKLIKQIWMKKHPAKSRLKPIIEFASSQEFFNLFFKKEKKELISALSTLI